MFDPFSWQITPTTKNMKYVVGKLLNTDVQPKVAMRKEEMHCVGPGSAPTLLVLFLTALFQGYWHLFLQLLCTFSFINANQKYAAL